MQDISKGRLSWSEKCKRWRRHRSSSRVIYQQEGTISRWMCLMFLKWEVHRLRLLRSSWSRMKSWIIWYSRIKCIRNLRIWIVWRCWRRSLSCAIKTWRIRVWRSSVITSRRRRRSWRRMFSRWTICTWWVRFYRRSTLSSLRSRSLCKKVSVRIWRKRRIRSIRIECFSELGRWRRISFNSSRIRLRVWKPSLRKQCSLLRVRRNRKRMKCRVSRCWMHCMTSFRLSKKLNSCLNFTSISLILLSTLNRM